LTTTENEPRSEQRVEHAEQVAENVVGGGVGANGIGDRCGLGTRHRAIRVGELERAEARCQRTQVELENAVDLDVPLVDVGGAGVGALRGEFELAAAVLATATPAVPVAIGAATSRSVDCSPEALTCNTGVAVSRSSVPWPVMSAEPVASEVAVTVPLTTVTVLPARKG